MKKNFLILFLVGIVLFTSCGPTAAVTPNTASSAPTMAPTTTAIFTPTSTVTATVTATSTPTTAQTQVPTATPTPKGGESTFTQKVDIITLKQGESITVLVVSPGSRADSMKVELDKGLPFRTTPLIKFEGVNRGVIITVDPNAPPREYVFAVKVSTFDANGAELETKEFSFTFTVKEVKKK